jgi:hypothetical protein
VGLRSPARDQQRSPALPLHLGDQIDGREPAFLRIPARHLGQQCALAETAAQLLDRRAPRRFEGVGRQPIGNHHRINTDLPHPVLHVAADGGDGGGRGEPAPRDAFEPEGVVGVPQDADAVQEAGAAQQPVEVEHRAHCLPFLGEDHTAPAGAKVGRQHLAEEIRRQ